MEYEQIVKKPNEFLELAMMFDTFKYIPRLSTKRIPIEEKESVASHIYEMIWLAYLSYYSMSNEDKKEIDLLKVIKLILWHEMDETLTNDIPYPAKKLLREQGKGEVLRQLKDVTSRYIYNRIPTSLLYNDKDVIDETLTDQRSNEKMFVKFLDYVNLFLNLVRNKRKGYPVDKAITECSRLTRFGNEFFDKVPLVKYLMDHPNEFLDMEDN